MMLCSNVAGGLPPKILQPQIVRFVYQHYMWAAIHCNLCHLTEEASRLGGSLPGACCLEIDKCCDAIQGMNTNCCRSHIIIWIKYLAVLKSLLKWRLNMKLTARQISICIGPSSHFCSSLATRHLLTMLIRFGFSRAAATLSLSFSCLLTASSVEWVPGVTAISTCKQKMTSAWIIILSIAALLKLQSLCQDYESSFIAFHTLPLPERGSVCTVQQIDY